VKLRNLYWRRGRKAVRRVTPHDVIADAYNWDQRVRHSSHDESIEIYSRNITAHGLLQTYSADQTVYGCYYHRPYSSLEQRITSGSSWFIIRVFLSRVVSCVEQPAPLFETGCVGIGLVTLGLGTVDMVTVRATDCVGGRLAVWSTAVTVAGLCPLPATSRKHFVVVLSTVMWIGGRYLWVTPAGPLTAATPTAAGRLCLECTRANNGLVSCKRCLPTQPAVARWVGSTCFLTWHLSVSRHGWLAMTYTLLSRLTHEQITLTTTPVAVDILRAIEGFRRAFGPWRNATGRPLVGVTIDLWRCSDLR